MEYTIDYTIDKTVLLGRGITSEVYLGFNNITMKKVAVKIIQKKIKNIKFYVENEILNLRILNFSPNIIQLIDHYETESEYILIFEYIELTLKQYIKTGITDKIKIDIVLQLITIAEVLRKNNIVHHDIKPDNILVQVNEAENRVKIKLCDFGMSILVGKKSHNKLCGSPIYMHPSKLLYNYNFNSDEWSINIIFYEIVYGKNPHKGTTTQTELIQNIYKNHITFPDYNIFTPLLRKIFYSSGNVFISAIKKDIEDIDKDIDKEIEEIEYVFV